MGIVVIVEAQRRVGREAFPHEEFILAKVGVKRLALLAQLLEQVTRHHLRAVLVRQFLLEAGKPPLEFLEQRLAPEILLGQEIVL